MEEKFFSLAWNFRKSTGVHFEYVHEFLWYYTLFFISNARVQLAKNQAKAKQHVEAEFLLFEIICFLHPRYHPNIK